MFSHNECTLNIIIVFTMNPSWLAIQCIYHTYTYVCILKWITTHLLPFTDFLRIFEAFCISSITVFAFNWKPFQNSKKTFVFFLYGNKNNKSPLAAPIIHCSRIILYLVFFLFCFCSLVFVFNESDRIKRNNKLQSWWTGGFGVSKIICCNIWCTVSVSGYCNLLFAHFSRPTFIHLRYMWWSMEYNMCMWKKIDNK